MKALKFSRKQLGIPYAVFIGLFVVLPLLLIVLYAFTVEDGTLVTNDITKFSFSFENFVYFFGSSANIRAIYVSFGLAIITTVICLLVAYPVAYILARSKMKWKNVVLMLFILPMWINFVLRTAAMKELLFKIGMYKSSKLSMVNTVIGMVYDYLPFTILPLYTVLIKLDKNILEASADLRHLAGLSVSNTVHGICQQTKRLNHLSPDKKKQRKDCKNREQRHQQQKDLESRSGLPELHRINRTDPEIHIRELSSEKLIVQRNFFQALLIL